MEESQEIELKRKNAPRFSEAENLALSEAVKARHHILFGKFDASTDKMKKEKAWREVVESVRAVSGIIRTKHQVQEKWKNLKKTAKSLASHNKKEIKKTGGGSADVKVVDACSQLVLETIPTSCVFGIEGGFDTSDAEAAFDLFKKPKPAILDASKTGDEPMNNLILTTPKATLCLVSAIDSSPESGEISNAVATIPSINDYEPISDDEDPGPSNTTNPTETPKSSKNFLLSRPNVSRRKKSKMMKGPMEVLQEKQLELFAKQLKLMEEIRDLMKRRNEIEEEKAKTG